MNSTEEMRKVLLQKLADLPAPESLDAADVGRYVDAQQTIVAELMGLNWEEMNDLNEVSAAQMVLERALQKTQKAMEDVLQLRQQIVASTLP